LLFTAVTSRVNEENVIKILYNRFIPRRLFFISTFLENAEFHYILRFYVQSKPTIRNALILITQHINSRHQSPSDKANGLSRLLKKFSIFYGSRRSIKCSQAAPLVPVLKKRAVPLQAWSGPEGSRKLRFPDFLTTAQDGGKVVSLTYRPHVLYKAVKVKQSRYRPGVAQRVPGN
jgi:hypothetical protein